MFLSTGKRHFISGPQHAIGLYDAGWPGQGQSPIGMIPQVKFPLPDSPAGVIKDGDGIPERPSTAF